VAAILGLASLPACAPLATASGAGPVPVADGPAPLSRWVLAVSLLAIAAGVLVVVWMALGGRRRGADVSTRLSGYTVTGHTSRGAAEGSQEGQPRTGVAASAVELADRVVRRRAFDETLALKLDAAGLPLRPAEWLLLHVGTAVGGAVVLLLLGGFRALPALIGLGLGVAVPFIVLHVKAQRRRRAFNDKLAGTLQLMSGSLAAGYSLPQAVDTVVREGVEPVSSEFNRAMIESRLGIPVEDALETVAERMHSQDFLWVVMAIRVQREVGGNLSELLTTVAATLRERAQLKRQVDVLSAEGRLSAWILTLLPVVFGLYLLLTRPEYLEPLLTDILGWVMLAVAGVLMLVGGFWMRNVVNVEV
jgi:tight adherence protein B